MNRRSRAGVALAVFAAVAVWLVVLLGSGDDEPATGAGRPERLVDVTTVDELEVRDPANGAVARLVAEDGALRVVEGRPVDEEDLARLHEDVTPLLAIRLLDGVEPEYALDPPLLQLVVRSGQSTHTVDLGAPNFDGTGVYARAGGRTALVLPRLVRILEELLDGAPG